MLPSLGIRSDYLSVEETPGPVFSKLVLSLCMIIGRLEIFPILVMFSRSTWRRV